MSESLLKNAPGVPLPRGRGSIDGSGPVGCGEIEAPFQSRAAEQAVRRLFQQTPHKAAAVRERVTLRAAKLLGAAVLLLAGLPPVASAADVCPWLNAATASGILGGPVTGATVKRANTGDDATCDFTRRDGSRLAELRIEVETMRSPAKDFASYTARCGSAAVPLKAIGNEAEACSGGDGAQLAEQVVGRVRDRAFLVRLGASDRSVDRSAMREKARKVAEQVAGILF